MKEECQKYLNIILEDFFERESVRCYVNICPALRSERHGLKVVLRYERERAIFVDKTGN